MAHIRNAAAAAHKRKMPSDVSSAGVFHVVANGDAALRAGCAACDMLANALRRAVAEKAPATT
jgi:hypothetical protein